MNRSANVRFLTLVFCAVLAHPVCAQVPASEYAERRSALMAKIDSGVVVAFGAVEPVNYWPTFFQLPAFQYLTGFGESDAVLVMVKRGGNVSTTMFVPTRSALEARWVGTRTAPADMAKRVPGASGRSIADLAKVTDSLAMSGLTFYHVPDVQTSDYATEDSLTRGARYLSRLKAARPSVRIESVDSLVNVQRAKKSPGEVALLRKATQISVRAHQEAMKATAPGCGEFEIQALMEGTFRRMGGDRPGYGSIVGSGPNATILHYMEDSRIMNDGELLLIDAASSFSHYSADVTRTFPVNGKFTPAQKDVYQIVRDAQEAFVRQIKTGSNLMASNDSGRTVIANGLAKLGLIESANATYDPLPGMQCAPAGCPQRSLFATHGYGGHGVGLEVHDPAQYYSREGKFQPGDVFTVEPGLYVDPDYLAQLPDTPKNRAMLAKIRPAVERYKWIGVRIEDVYSLGDRGLEWMSEGAPREINEIETLMTKREPELPGGGTCGRTKS
jgi:Xaa-Pro aminopeptidase